MSARSTQRILHVEDDSDLVQIVGRQIGNEVSFVSAGSLAAARQLLGKERFDLVILDLVLPDGHGEDLLPLMINPDGAPIPVIIFSATEVPVEIGERVEAVLIKSRSSDQMLTEAIDAFVTRNNLGPPSPGKNDIDDRTVAHG
jgi:DNA-binding response OmpR family regulator